MSFFSFADAIFIPDEKGELLSLQPALAAQELPASSGDFGMAFAKMFLTLLALIILLFLTYWAIKKFVQARLQKGVGDPLIQILEKKMISPKTMLYIVEVEGKKILFAESHLEIKRLESLSETPHSEIS